MSEHYSSIYDDAAEYLADRSKLLATVDALTARNVALATALGEARLDLAKVVAHTGYTTPTPALLAGLLASCKRIADAGITKIDALLDAAGGMDGPDARH